MTSVLTDTPPTVNVTVNVSFTLAFVIVTVFVPLPVIAKSSAAASTLEIAIFASSAALATFTPY